MYPTHDEVPVDMGPVKSNDPPTYDYTKKNKKTKHHHNNKNNTNNNNLNNDCANTRTSDRNYDRDNRDRPPVSEGYKGKNKFKEKS